MFHVSLSVIKVDAFARSWRHLIEFIMYRPSNQFITIRSFMSLFESDYKVDAFARSWGPLEVCV